MGNPNAYKFGFGSPGRTKEFDDAARAKAIGIPKKRKWTKDVCIFQLEELMDILKRKIEDENLKDLQIITDKMMDIIRYLYPPVQQNLNVNVDITANTVMERLKSWKQEQVVDLGDLTDVNTVVIGGE